MGFNVIGCWMNRKNDKRGKRKERGQCVGPSFLQRLHLEQKFNHQNGASWYMTKEAKAVQLGALKNAQDCMSVLSPELIDCCPRI